VLCFSGTLWVWECYHKLFLEHIALEHGYTILGLGFLSQGLWGHCICIHISWCVCVCCFYDMYIFIGWLHDLRTLNLDVHGYSCCSDISNAVSWE
jgi:hypothetical protein